MGLGEILEIIKSLPILEAWIEVFPNMDYMVYERPSLPILEAWIEVKLEMWM